MTQKDETRDLVERVREGDQPAFEELFARHRDRLERLVRSRMDRRLGQRMEPSDIVQEAYLEAARRFEGYSRNPQMSFYIWLRWIAREKIIQQYRRHLDADKRAIGREESLVSPEVSSEFGRELISPDASPSQEVAAAEISEIVEKALDRLAEEDRQILIWRSFEQLTVEETAELLDISRAAAGKRYLRALEKVRKHLNSLGLSSG